MAVQDKTSQERIQELFNRAILDRNQQLNFLEDAGSGTPTMFASPFNKITPNFNVNLQTANIPRPTQPPQIRQAQSYQDESSYTGPSNAQLEKELADYQKRMEWEKYLESLKGPTYTSPTMDFIKQINDSFKNSGIRVSSPSIEQYDALYKKTGQAYPVASGNDGSIIYSDGSRRLTNRDASPTASSILGKNFKIYSDGSTRDDNAYPVASGIDGTVIYSDGSRRIVDRDSSGKQIFSTQSPGYTPDDERSGNNGIFGNISDIGNKIGSRLNVRYTVKDESGNEIPVDQFKQSDGVINAGAEGLSQAIFGKNQYVTSEYGTNRGSYRHGGIDFRIRDLTEEEQNMSLPVTTKVIQVFYDDGIRSQSSRNHYGYGNSILLELPSGERLRFSHLENAPEFKPGDVVLPGQVFGNAGNSGNSTAEHLDLEYYTADGRRENPRMFSGLQEPRKLHEEDIIVRAEISPSLVQKEELATSSAQVRQYVEQKSMQTNEPVASSSANIASSSAQMQPNISQVSQQSDIGRISPQVLGMSTTNSDYQRQMDQARSLQRLAPSLNTERLVAEQDTNPFRQFAGNVVDKIGNTIGLGEKGISELLAGGKTTNTQDPTKMFSENRLYSTEEPLNQNKPNENEGSLVRSIKDLKDSAVDKATAIGEGVSENAQLASQKAGEGIKKIQGIFGSAGGFFSKPSSADISMERAIGQGGNQAQAVNASFETPKIQASQAKNDIRDDFFKQGLDKVYGQYIDQSKIGDGAVSMELFKDDFYKNRQNVENVFDGTFLQDNAMNKFGKFEAQRVKDEFLRKYSDPKYDQADVQRIAGSVPNVLLASMQLPEPKIKYVAPPPPPTYSGGPGGQMPSIQDYLNKGRSVQNWYAETGQQNLYNSLNSRNINPLSYAQDLFNRSAGGVSGGSNQNFTPSYANSRNSSTGNWEYNPSNNSSSYSQSYNNDLLRYGREEAERIKKDYSNKRSGGISSGPSQNFTPNYGNYSKIGGGIGYAPPPKLPEKNNWWENAKKTVSGVFKSWFN